MYLEEEEGKMFYMYAIIASVITICAIVAIVRWVS